MNVTDLLIIGNIQYGVPSGTYDGSSQDFYSEAQPGVGYYLGQGSLQIVSFRVVGFSGRITVEATLGTDPVLSSWFTVAEYGDTSSVITDYHPISITGNFAWVRVHIQDFSQGSIESVRIAY